MTYVVWASASAWALSSLKNLYVFNLKETANDVVDHFKVLDHLGVVGLVFTTNLFDCQF